MSHLKILKLILVGFVFSSGAAGAAADPGTPLTLADFDVVLNGAWSSEHVDRWRSTVERLSGLLTNQVEVTNPATEPRTIDVHDARPAKPGLLINLGAAYDLQATDGLLVSVTLRSDRGVAEWTAFLITHLRTSRATAYARWRAEAARAYRPDQCGSLLDRLPFPRD